MEGLLVLTLYLFWFIELGILGAALFTMRKDKQWFSFLLVLSIAYLVVMIFQLGKLPSTIE